MVFVVLLVDVGGSVGICVFYGGVDGLGIGIGGIRGGLSGIGGGIGCGVGGPSVAIGGRSIERYKIGLQTYFPSIPTDGLSIGEFFCNVA
ncbi:hypothetical protein FXO38_15783 [Capsicum annuum]|nr:hypothetical protein FXO38_15783 [Capsicum annuum]KAF3667695.1 hypothetical protein FXO37_09897 [Capsicum annuum]